MLLIYFSDTFVSRYRYRFGMGGNGIYGCREFLSWSFGLSFVSSVFSSLWYLFAFMMRVSILFSCLPLALNVLGSASLSDITAKSFKAFAAREDVEERGDLEKRVTLSEILTDIEDAATCSACEVCTSHLSKLIY